MNKTNPQPYFQDLSVHFTSDAWQLLNSFLNNLQSKLKEFNIANIHLSTIIEGIDEFIQDFIEDYKDRAKITFSETLNLIQEIGSPSEIIISLDIPLEHIMKQSMDITLQEAEGVPQEYVKITCRSCNWLNEPDAIFCDNCGVRLVNDLTRRIQFPRIIERYPNASAIVFSFLSLLLIGYIEAVGVFFAGLNTNSDITLTELLLISTAIMILPGVIFGLIFGYLLERLNRNELILKPPSRFVPRSTATAVGFSYLLLLAIFCFIGFIIYLTDIDSGPTMLIDTVVPVAVVIALAPAAIFGLALAYLVNHLYIKK